MRVDSLRLDDVLARDIALAWNEGVAVTQAICRELTDAANVGGTFPLAHEVAITAQGTVSLLRRPSGSPGVAAAGQLLGEMLRADVPVRLRLIHSDAVATLPTFHSVQQLSEALSYFERPDSVQLIQQLFTRAAAAAPGVTAPQEPPVVLDDFLSEADTAPAVATAPSFTPEPPHAIVKPDVTPVHQAAPRPPQSYQEFQPQRNNRRRQAGMAVAAALVVFAMLGSAAFLGSRPDGSESATAATADAAIEPESARPTSTTGARPAAKRADSRPDAPARSESGAKAVASPASRAEVRGRANDAASIAAPAPDRAKEADVFFPDPAATALGPMIALEPLVRGGSASSAPIDSVDYVYSRATADVVPPTAIRPHLPSEPPLDYPMDRLMVLDLVVTSKGDVESVRLLTPPKTVNDFMIVSAAKAWLFAPAKLNGRAVKYRHRIRFVVP